MKEVARHAIFTMLLLVLAGCATVDTRWQQANSANTVQAYKTFLRRHPDSEYKDRAREKIESLHWQKTTAKQSTYAFKRYLRVHPDGEHATEARNQIELLEWENAKKGNRLSGYEAFLEKYPASRYSVQARTEIQTFAEVLVDFLDKLKSRESYYNIGRPVWVYRIVFRETNGVGATITQKKMHISGRDGREWGDWTYLNIKKVNIPPGGTGEYTSWVNSPNCNLCGGTMYLDYKGTDAYGHSIHVSTRFVLEK